MKRLLSILLAVVLVLSAVALISCNDDEPNDTTAPVTTNDPGTNPPDPGTEPGTNPGSQGTTGAPFEGDYTYPY